MARDYPDEESIAVPMVRGTATRRANVTDGESLRVRLDTINGLMNDCHRLISEAEERFVPQLNKVGNSSAPMPPGPPPINTSVTDIENSVRSLRDRLTTLNDRL